MLTVPDVLVLLILVLAVIGGWRVGGAVIAGHIAGLLVGLIAGLWVAGLLSDTLSPVAHLLLGVLCAVGGTLLGGAAGRFVGRLIARALHGAGAGLVDRALGAVARGGLALVLCWIIAALVASFGPARWADSVRASTLLNVDDSTPVAGQVTARLREIAPDDLAALVPASGAGEPNTATLRSVEQTVAGSVFLISASGCPQGVTGTGFVAGHGLVVTNAHVVRGATTITADTTSGERTATPLVVDRRADLAVLQVDGAGDSDLPSLTLASSDARNGTGAVVVGYPGGSRTAIGAVVLQRAPIPTPGLTDGLALHQAYRIRAAIRHGNSGSPLLDTSGRVVGVVNALSGSDGQQGYATTIDELLPDLARASRASAVASTGSCS